ncbi:MAG: response regulator [Alphaproteobacteria bacterium]|nr:response regulator [Alphaproteobacteria bacterium]
MSHLGTLLLVSGDSRGGQGLTTRLTEGGFDVTFVSDGAKAIKAAQDDHPDIIVSLTTLPDMSGIDLANKLKEDAETADIPVALLCDHFSTELSQQALEAHIDDLVVQPIDPGVLVARLKPLLRLSTMHTELSRRAQVASRFGVEAAGKVDIAVNDANQQILLVSRDKKAAQTYAGLLAKASVTITENLIEAEDLLTQKNFDAALLDVTDSPAEHLSLCSQIRNNSRLFNLPVLLIAAPGTFADPVEPYRRGASRVLVRPSDPDLLVTALLALVRRQRLRWRIREALLKTMGKATGDDRTAAYSKEFMLAHLAGRLEHARRGGRNLSLVYLNIPNISAVVHQFGKEAGEQLLAQLGNWIMGLLRAEDLTARSGDSEFCLVLPDTPIEEAEIVMHRIASVLTYTDFAVPDVYQPVKVWVEVGSALAREDDSVETLLARAHTRLG